MPIVLRSPNHYQGLDSLPTLASLTYGYTQYAERVISDGGVIINESATISAFDFLASNGLPLDQMVVGASFGVKHAGGLVQKLYSFNGNDFIPWFADMSLGQGPYFDTSGVFPVVSLDASNTYARYLKSLKQRPITFTGSSGFVQAMVSQNVVANDNRQVNITTGQDGSPGYFATQLNSSNTDYGTSNYSASGESAFYNPAGQKNTGYIQTAIGPAYSDYLGFAVHYDITNNLISTFGDGVASGTKAIGSGMFNYREVPLRTYIGADFNSGPVYAKSQRFAEFWSVRSASAAFALSLSARLGTLY